MSAKGLHVTDAEVLAIAKERGGIVKIEVARKTAKIYKIAYAGTLYILVKSGFSRANYKGKGKTSNKRHGLRRVEMQL